MSIEQHNRGQVSYFASADQQTIIPAETPYVLRHLQRLLQAGAIREHDRVLEIGAGIGRFTHLLKQRGIDVTASDISPELIAAMHEHMPDVEAFVSDVMHLSQHSDQHFDVVTGFFMLHHLPDLEGAFKSIASVLKPGGRVVFCEPNAWFFPFYLQILLTPRMRWSVDKGVMNMHRSVLTPALEAAGFSHVTYDYYGFLPPQVYNLGWGRGLDSMLEALPLPGRAHAFQVVTADYEG